MTQVMKSLLLGTVCSTILLSQTATKKPIEGVWKVIEIVVTGERPSNVPNPQPGLFIFTKTHYSMLYIPGNQPRALFKGQEPTNEEKILAFDSFVAHTGTYEVADSSLTRWAVVARYPNFMAGGASKHHFRIEGNTLWLTQKSTNQTLRVGEAIVPQSGPVRETRFKLVRVE